LEEPGQYFGRLLLGDSGVVRLIERARFEHRDNRPRLEFVAARRFLDPGAEAVGVFDSLVQIGSRSDGISPFALVRLLAARRSDTGVLPYLEAARRAQPNVAEWTVRTAAIRLAMGDSAGADSLLTSALAHGPRGDALLMRAMIATDRREPRARALIAAALAAGGDTAQARAARALLAVRAKHWQDAAVEARGALAAAQGTFRHPYPAQFLSEALIDLSLQGPPALADSLLSFAVTRRPGSARYKELASVAALRAGRCEEAAAEFVELLDFGIERENGPALVRECWGGLQRPMVTPRRAVGR
jgi:hypothetical protein